MFLASYFTLWFTVTLLALIAVGLLREIVQLKHSAQQPTIPKADPLVMGSRAPTFCAKELVGERIFCSKDIFSENTLLLFVSPRCSVCRRILSDLNRSSKVATTSWTLMCCGDTQDFIRLVGLFSITVIRTLVDPDRKIGDLYGVQMFPFAVLVDNDRRLLSYANPQNMGELMQFANLAKDAKDREILLK